MFAHQQGKQLSLLDLIADLYEQYGVSVSKQSLNERFNQKAVDFMKQVLSQLLSHQLNNDTNAPCLSGFSKVRIKDSTRFALPGQHAQTYKGYGGATNSSSMISIQYEYDLISGATMDLQLTSGTRNDQQDSKESLGEIGKNELFIRDLGYITVSYLKKVTGSGAYFLNRLPSQPNVYQADDPQQAIDFKKCYKKMKKYNLPFLEYNVLISKRARIPSRLVIFPVDEQTYQRRVRKTEKQAKSYGHQVSDEFKIRARLNLFITNAAREWIPAAQIKQIYGLRWQVELIFKIWKSQGQINQVKQMKIQRFECQLLAKIIWLLINWKIFKMLGSWVAMNHQEMYCSVWKYFKSAYRLCYQIRQVIRNPEKMYAFLEKLMEVADIYFLLESRRKKPDHYQSFKILT